MVYWRQQRDDYPFSTYLHRIVKIYEEHEMFNNKFELFITFLLLTLESRDPASQRKLLRSLKLCQTTFSRSENVATTVRAFLHDSLPFITLRNSTSESDHDSWKHTWEVGLERGLSPSPPPPPSPFFWREGGGDFNGESDVRSCPDV